MSGEVQENLRRALQLMLKPLVKLLINQGVTHGDFSEVVKDVYVEMAIRQDTNGQRINQSRIAILAGLTRKEVKNVLDRVSSSNAYAKDYSRPSKVLTGWHSDPRFIGPYGIPLELPFDASDSGEPSFKELVKVYGSDMAPRQMYQVLLDSGAVLESEPGVLTPVRRSFEPTGLSPELIERFGNIAHNFFLTAAGNIEKKSQDEARLERVVATTRIWEEHELDELRSMSKENGQQLLEYIDNWFVGLNKGMDPGAIEKAKVLGIESGLGIYHYVESKEDKSSLRDLLIERGLEIDKKE